MPASRTRSSRFSAPSRQAGDRVVHSLSDFYREEFLRCQRSLDEQREFYSERAIEDMDRALLRVMAELDRLCATRDANQVVSELLREFNLSAGLFTWSDHRQVH